MNWIATSKEYGIRLVGKLPRKFVQGDNMTEPRVKLIEIAKKLFFTYKSLSLYQTDYFELIGAIKEAEQLESRIRELEERLVEVQGLTNAVIGCDKTCPTLSSLRQSAKGLVNELEQYCEHDRRCELAHWQAGEPRPDGSYWSKYGDKWYQFSPINNLPKCSCGLDEALKRGER
jgi:hypothetical protein